MRAAAAFGRRLQLLVRRDSTSDGLLPAEVRRCHPAFVVRCGHNLYEEPNKCARQ